ncbi:unnamed protein product [Linum trigynum]|uniref:Uncharacterized protein n=1 Tax=Linum trigynum TaxID=586398 RepID=A0AAV2G0R5_9ROSI
MNKNLLGVGLGSSRAKEAARHRPRKAMRVSTITTKARGTARGRITGAEKAAIARRSSARRIALQRTQMPNDAVLLRL